MDVDTDSKLTFLNSFTYIHGRESLCLGRIFKIEVFTDLHVFKSSESKNQVLEVDSDSYAWVCIYLCVCLISKTQNS